MAATDALILDFDGSVLPLPGSKRLNLSAWQERFRFGCSMSALEQLDQMLGTDTFTYSDDSDEGADDSVQAPKVAFLGSGDFHHVSYSLIHRCSGLRRNLQVVVLDNHPDNMRYPWGVHCGSWVSHVSRLPFVNCVHVLGITSRDVEITHSWENHWGSLRSGKVRYWCVGRNVGWMKYLGMDGNASYTSVSAMLDAFNTYQRSSTDLIYLSIDKDVLAVDELRTNWDQGVMRVGELRHAIGMLRPRIAAADITGDVSVYKYRSAFKRLLSGLDTQPNIAAGELSNLQLRHRDVNLQLLQCLR